jgi:hypothetical protein
MGEVQNAQLAEQRSTLPQVKEFAQRRSPITWRRAMS